MCGGNWRGHTSPHTLVTLEVLLIPRKRDTSAWSPGIFKKKKKNLRRPRPAQRLPRVGSKPQTTSQTTDPLLAEPTPLHPSQPISCSIGDHLPPPTSPESSPLSPSLGATSLAKSHSCGKDGQRFGPFIQFREREQFDVSAAIFHVPHQP